ncbi:MAG: SSU rRNA (adenine(1518)-N(6)/adenine(1519)-N(6))-dimethyltransferase, partial [uncultured Friedmanniella sp.]
AGDRAGPGVADPGPARGGRRRRRGRDRRAAGRRAAGHGRRADARPRRRADRGHRGRPAGDRAARRPHRRGGQPALQRLGPGAAAPAGHLPELAARAGDGAAGGRRPAGRPPGLEDLRCALGQDGLVRRLVARRDRAAQRLLAGAQRRVRAGADRPAAGPGHHRHPRAGVRRRRRGLRAAPQDAPLGPVRAGRQLGRGQRGAGGRRRRPADPRRDARGGRLRPDRRAARARRTGRRRPGL